MKRLQAIPITDEIVERFRADMKAKADRRRAFFKSDVCKRMIADIEAVEPLTCDEVWYFTEATQFKYGWTDLSKETMIEFVEVMADSSGADAFISNHDPENPFSHSVHLKGGIAVFSMHGQGTVNTFMALKDMEPELAKELTELAATRSAE